MNSIKLMCAAAVLTISVSVPAYAQMAKGGMMSSDKPMQMSMADKKKMASCQKMSHRMMMRNSGCAKMMKMHPDMMNSGMMKK